MDPMTWMAILSLAGNVVGGLTGGGGGGQDLESFKGTALDPIKMGSLSAGNISQAGKTMTDRMKNGIQLRGVGVQQPGGYSGGGLPMNIGLSATDPSIKDPSINSRPGIDFGNIFPNAQDFFKAADNAVSTGGHRTNINNKPVIDTAVPRGQGRVPSPITTDPTGSHEEALQHMRRLGFRV